MDKEKIKTIVILSLIFLIVMGIISYAFWNDGYKKGYTRFYGEMYSSLVNYGFYNFVYTYQNETLMIKLVPYREEA